MRNPISLALAILAVSAAPLAQAACEYPANVKIPNGSTATQEDISAANTAVKKYLGDLEAYMDCLDAEVAALPVDQQTPETKALHVKRYNAAVDAMEQAAASFNAELKAFKAVNK